MPARIVFTQEVPHRALSDLSVDYTIVRVQPSTYVADSKAIDFLKKLKETPFKFEKL